jgi:Ni/Co efflux regulator RcnB
MNITARRWGPSIIALAAVLAVAVPSWAGKPDWVEEGGKGQGKHKDQHKDQDKGGRDRDRGPAHASPQPGASIQIGGSSLSVSIQFGDSQRRTVRDYYAPSVAAGNCPPGLAKKNNGCLPPGQAKQWRRGAPLPGGVVMYPVPRDLEIRLGVPPAGHKYVRVAADILLIAVGTSMVVDAIEDLAGL